MNEAISSPRRRLAGDPVPWLVSGRRTWLALFALCAGGFAAGAMRAEPAQEIFVPSGFSSSIQIFASTDNGNVAPARQIVGGSTGLASTYALAVDGVNLEIVAANLGTPSVTVYETSDTGNATPTRTIAGAATALESPIAIAVDWIHDEIVVLGGGGDTVTAYPRDANGNVPPLRTLTGASTGILAGSLDLALDLVHGELIVASSDTSDEGVRSVRVFDRDDTGNVSPKRAIEGPATGLDYQISAVEVDTVHDEILVAGATFGVLVFARTANGDVAPLRQIQGSTSGLNGGAIGGLALDLRRNELLVTQQFSNDVRVFDRLADGDVAPLRVIQGASTQMSTPTRLDVVPALLLADGFEGGNTDLWIVAPN